MWPYLQLKIHITVKVAWEVKINEIAYLFMVQFESQPEKELSFESELGGSWGINANSKNYRNSENLSSLVLQNYSTPTAK